MAQLWEVISAGAELLIKRDLNSFVKTDDNDRLTAITGIQALSDDARTSLISDFGVADLGELDTLLEDEEFELRQRIASYDYDTRVVNTTVLDGAWFTPDSVESFCGETSTNVVGNSIDGVNTTFWRHSQDHQHTVTYLLRSYPNKISRIRFRYNSTEPANERLNNMDVHAAKNLARIDNAENILETGINISWPVGQGSVWVEHTLAKKKTNARYVKLVIDDTDNASNTLQIREFAVWVEPLQDKESL
ncbi:MAG: hypothetical protein ACR2OV_15895 [Hyphomicrobiaceae bacterium]